MYYASIKWQCMHSIETRRQRKQGVEMYYASIKWQGQCAGVLLSVLHLQWTCDK